MEGERKGEGRKRREGDEERRGNERKEKKVLFAPLWSCFFLFFPTLTLIFVLNHKWNLKVRLQPQLKLSCLSNSNQRRRGGAGSKDVPWKK